MYQEPIVWHGFHFFVIFSILGASFGASGSEPFISYVLLGLVGGAFWSLPFTIVFKGNYK